VRHPQVGDLYWVPSFLIPGDPEDARPVVVLETPRSPLDRVEVMPRTHDTTLAGVEHPADPANGCNKRGVFAMKYFLRIEFDDFVTYAEHRGYLADPYLARVLHMWRTW
jgi:hypothetical protein